jgi:hypothetical protein
MQHQAQTARQLMKQAPVSRVYFQIFQRLSLAAAVAFRPLFPEIGGLAIQLVHAALPFLLIKVLNLESDAALLGVALDTLHQVATIQ